MNYVKIHNLYRLKCLIEMGDVTVFAVDGHIFDSSVVLVK